LLLYELGSSQYLEQAQEIPGESPCTTTKSSRCYPHRIRSLGRADIHYKKNSNPGLLFDYSGFPEETYQLQWPAGGDPHLALQVRNLLEKAGNYTHTDENRGYDHGVFVPLKIAFPAADIPCVQLSLQAGLDPETHYLAGESLTSLRDENVLILGSGNTFHNIPVLMRGIKNKTDNIA
jgi:aromatic ring-opening dioxygenase catalytic subunit (LigB family)